MSHPTYRALSELGRAVKMIFLCRYLHSEQLRREIHKGLNVIEQWNGPNDFVVVARRGELASNRHEDHVLSLHLLQNCMVYVNTASFGATALGWPLDSDRLPTTDAVDLEAGQP
jgi:TnpA family transposase